jgi:hypothetical protein
MSDRAINPEDLPSAYQECPLAEPEVDLPPIVSYYDRERKEFLIKNKRGVYLSLPETAFKRHLRAAGISTKAQDGAALSAADAHILDTQHHRDLAYSGPLCGRQMGFYEEGQTRFLVTESFTLPTPAPGHFATIRALIYGLLGGDAKYGKTQVDVFLSWMQLAQVALRAGRIQASQALAIAGPPGCGKSLLQALITAMLGGRQAKPYRYLSGGTDFNGELFEAEHLVLEDEFMSRRISDRQKLGAGIKNICVSSRSQSCHRKNRQAINLPAWWRLSITLNDDPEALLVLPPLDEHVADKIILLRASRFDFPLPMDSAAAQGEFMDTCKAEIPAFLNWLLNSFTIPDALAAPRRYGVTSWHHPALKSELDTLSPESDLLALIDEVIWDTSREEWRGTSDEMQRILFDGKQVAPQARRLLDHRNACGTYLSRLATKPNPRGLDAGRWSWSAGD